MSEGCCGESCCEEGGESHIYDLLVELKESSNDVWRCS